MTRVMMNSDNLMTIVTGQAEKTAVNNI